MSLFLVLAALLAVSTVALLARASWRAESPDRTSSTNSELAALRQQMAQLTQLHAAGALGDAQFGPARTALERRIVDAALGAPAASAAAASTAQRPSKALLTGLAAFVVVVVAGGYSWLGTPAALDPAAAMAQESSGETGDRHSVTFEQIAAMAEKLAARLKENPDDAQGWAMLGRSYAVMGRHADSLAPLRKAMALQKDDPVLLADYADALAVVNNRSLEGEPMKLIDQALKLDPNNLKALSLAGTAAFNRQDFALAIRHWEKLTQVAPKDSPFIAQVLGGIDEARRMLGANARAPAPAPMADAGGKAAANAVTISGTVTLAASLAAQAAPGDTVFVFARAVEGPRMPLAIVRKRVSDLPFRFTLDDSSAMSPATKLSTAGKVIVGARISKSGDAIPRAGDLQGQSGVVSPGASGLAIEIGQVVGP